MEVEAFPLSYAQQRLWFLNQFEDEAARAAYNIQTVWSLKGPLNHVALERALNAIIQRHEILRTRFVLTGDDPLQVIVPALRIGLQFVDLAHLPPELQESAISSAIAEDGRRNFDLESGPLIRTQLLKKGPREHIWLLTLHHIVFDGWSMGLLLRELRIFYNAFCQEEEAALPELAIQYADYSLWQRDWLRAEVLEKYLGFWRNALAGAPGLLELPWDHPRPPVQTYQGATETAELEADATAAVLALAHRHEATLYMTTLAAFSVLLCRCSAVTDIVIGTPVANRTQEAVEDVIGFFVNTLALRIDLSGDPSFTVLLDRVKRVVQSALQYQELPFERLVQELQPQRELSYHPLFQVMFILHNLSDPLELNALEVKPLKNQVNTAIFDLTLSLYVREGQLAKEAYYNTNLFEGETIRAWMRQYECILQAVSRNPSLRCSEIPLISAQEHLHLALQGEPVVHERPVQASVIDFFTEQARRTPDAVAVMCEGESLMYGSLNRKTNQIAHGLLASGVAQEARVGICMGRCMEMVAGILGVLKAGAAYVPLDINYPLERLQYMVQDSGIELILTTRRCLPFAESLKRPTLLINCDEQAEFMAEAAARIESGQLAYVIYTSGSTGWPKGVAVSHENLLYSTMARSRVYKENVKSFLMVSSFAFDSSVAGVFWTLAHGGALHLPSEQEQRDALALAEKIKREKISHLLCLPALYQQILESADNAGLNTLTTIIVAGETCPTELVALHDQKLPQTRLYNEYGPTEATVWSTVYLHEHGKESRSVPIGKAIPYAGIRLLDQHGNLVLEGQTGELCIGGQGISRGYLNQPALTAQRFVPDSFAQEPGKRLYRTGDLGRYLKDGNIEYLGRKDEQIKIRGYRIELTEIEAALNRHADVREAAVWTPVSNAGDKRLIGYIVAAPGSTLDGATLKSFLKITMPDYMVPGSFVFLDQLPRLPNGKVDRKKLPVPQEEIKRAGEMLARPGTPMEILMRDIWSEVLGVREIGLDDNFFDLGGHSLLITRVRLGLRRKLNYDIPIVDFFANPTIRALARKLEGEEKTPSHASASQKRAAEQREYLQKRARHVRG